MNQRHTKVIILVLFLVVVLLVFREYVLTEMREYGQECLCAATTKKADNEPVKCKVPPTTPSAYSDQKIPKRIHQIFKNRDIPEPYHEHIVTWKKNHPDWEYYFWTDSDAEAMIKDRYPQFMKLYNKYTYPLSRSDVIRYFILHQYGGVYADLDMTSIKPMDSFLKGNSCVLSPEPSVQTNLIFNFDLSLTNCIMASTPNHPFLTHVLNGLSNAYLEIKGNWDVLHSTGPFYLNKTYNEYMTEYKDCKGKYCDVFVPSHVYLVPRFDVPDLKGNVNDICVKSDIGVLQRRACETLVNSNYKNDLPKEAVTDHMWLHLGWENVKEENKKKGVNFNTKPIHELVQKIITYK